MPSHTQTRWSAHSPEALFDLVADIERYPEFLPWCVGARILSRGENACEAELMIRFKGITESYVSRVTFDRPRYIESTLLRGPFSRLHSRWELTPENDGTRIDFSLDFAFRSRVLDKLIGPIFAHATAAMAEAFRQRAEALYGHKDH